MKLDRRLLGLLAATLGLALFACQPTTSGSQSAPASGGKTLNVHANFKATITNFKASGGTDEDGDGAIDRHYTMTVTRNGLSTAADVDGHTVEIDEDDHPVMSDQLDTLVVRDVTANNSRTYNASQDRQSFAGSDGSNTLNLMVNPDSTLMVNGAAAATASDAATLAKQSPVIAGATPESLTALHSVINNRVGAAENALTAEDAVNVLRIILTILEIIGL